MSLHRVVWNVAAAALLATPSLAASAGAVYGNNGLTGGFRWDAAPRTIGGLERSLAGGLRYSLEGGSYEAYRDQFSWNVTPTVAEFQTAVEQAFNAWTSFDPVTRLGTSVSFVPDFDTPVDDAIVSFVRQGAEIDLFATNFGDNRTRGTGFFNASSGRVTLTSGTTNYFAAPINGADIDINSNPGAVYTLDLFRRLLTHEIGHAIGLGDVEAQFNQTGFIDDNYDGSTAESARETLNNSWALLVNTANPANSDLQIYDVPQGSRGVGEFGVNILMESNGLGISPDNPLTNLVPLTNDDYGTRQFLYPSDLFGPPIGDLNGDSVLTDADISAFVMALTDLTAFEAAYPGIDPDLAGDFTGDGRLTNSDLAGFIEAIRASAGQAVPEPSSIAWIAGVWGLMLTRRRR